MKQRALMDLVDGIAPVIMASFAKAMAPIAARVEAAEKRLADLADLFKAPPTPAEIDAIVAAAVEKALAEHKPKEVAALELKVDGGDLTKAVEEAIARIQPDEAAVRAFVAEEMAKANAASPKVEDIVAGHVGKAVDKLVADLDEIRDLVMGLPGPDGLVALVDKAVDAKVLALPATPTAAEVAALVPVPAAGKDADPDVLKAMVAEAVAALPPAKDGADATPEQIAAAVEKVLATWERPKDGESVTIEQLRPLVDETVSKHVAEIPAPKDGVGLAGALIDRDGELALTLTDGTVTKLGRVVGKDGDPGKDGLGFENLDVVDEDDAIVIGFARGDVEKEFRIPKPTLADCYRGVWREGAFKRGDAVTWGGSLWIAQRATEVRPETKDNDDWKLAVKRGRDGKDLTSAEPKPPTKVKL